ncbi:MAG TPA: BamA/TamA family outer membrane protein [Verrucomicrobiae bacterium]|nr:BamA/TamA family outer membrane protein [Verrucomicrobiae bacterium]
MSQAFSLGGSGDLRGYRHNFLSGDTYWYAGGEYLRPIGWDWLRAVAFVEAGNVFQGDGNVTVDDTYVDVGLGLRLRFSRFVNFELNAGVALPLVDAGDGKGARFFATGRR